VVSTWNLPESILEQQLLQLIPLLEGLKDIGANPAQSTALVPLSHDDQSQAHNQGVIECA